MEQSPANAFQPVKKFPVLYGTRRFITVFTTARHFGPIQSQINPIHAVLFYSFKVYFIVPTTLGFSQCFPSGFLTNTLYALLLPPPPPPPTVRATCLAFVILLNFINLIKFGEENRSSSFCSVCSLLLLPPLRPSFRPV